MLIGSGQKSKIVHGGPQPAARYRSYNAVYVLMTFLKKTDSAGHSGIFQSPTGDIESLWLDAFEEALAALERIVDDLERGDVPLDQSIRIYERGEALKAHCEKLLKAAEDKVEKIRLSREGKPTGTEPLDSE